MTKKDVQIPQEVFLALVKYFLVGIQDNEQINKTITSGLRNKLDAIIKHDLYTQYKSAPTKEAQEAARQEYLDKIGAPNKFRW